MHRTLAVQTPPLTNAPGSLLHAIAALVNAPLSRIAEHLREATEPHLESSALIIFTEDCTGRPQKKAGEEAIITRVSIFELENLRSLLVAESRWIGEAIIAGELRKILAMKHNPSNALLVITDPAPSAGEQGHSDALNLVGYLWDLAARRIQDKLADAPPSYLLESRAASAERVRVTAELVDQNSTTLETILAALRSPALDDAAARSTAINLAAKALVGLRTLNESTTNLVEEPVVTAFERLRDDLRPLTRFSDIDVQFIEPPVNGRALPGEVAHAARAVVRGLVLTMMEQPDVRRIRVQWDCDGENLLIDVRDDGGGKLTAETPGVERLDRRVQAMAGRMRIGIMSGWGTDVSVSLPLDPPSLPLGDITEWNLAARELEVLQHLVSGQRNRAIALELNISENTVKFHIRNIFRKLDIRSRSEAVALAHSHGIR